MKRIALIALVFAAAALTAFGDIPRPKTPTPAPTPKAGKPFEGRIHVDLRSDVKVPTLKLRREMLRELRAAIDEAEGAGDTAAATAQVSQMGTIVSGTLFSLALVFAGVLLFRKRSGSSKLAVSAMVISILGIGSLVVFANTPPPSVVGLTTRIFDKHTKVYGYASGNVRVEILDRKPGVFTGLDSTDVILEIPDGGEGKDAE